MPAINQSAKREIIEDFAKEIKAKLLTTARPDKEVINFRNELQYGVQRDVVKVPIEILRYRKDNGRIASDVLDYERNIGPLDETDSESQAIIRDFLEKKDPERTETLKKSIFQVGQQEPAIITCDGFLINGNRRKVVLEILKEEYPGNDKFAYINVVILPGEGEEGGPPTLLEIEKIENRYQLQKTGKSEYYGFDRALSIKRKIELGFSLEEQIMDDPNYSNLSKAALKRVVEEYEKDFLAPLECVDDYLRQFRRENLYKTISSGMADREGRWQAFKDYSNTLNRNFKNGRKRLELGIEEDEIGEIQEAAFNIIRLRTVPDMPKVHVIMRDLHKYCQTVEGKKYIKKIAAEVEPELPEEECIDDDGKRLSLEAIDNKWASKYKEEITYNLVNAVHRRVRQKDKEKPIELLEAAYKKLTHEDMDVQKLEVNDFDKARILAVDIQQRANAIESEIYHYKKKLKNLPNIGKKKT